MTGRFTLIRVGTLPREPRSASFRTILLPCGEGVIGTNIVNPKREVSALAIMMNLSFTQEAFSVNFDSAQEVVEGLSTARIMRNDEFAAELDTARALVKLLSNAWEELYLQRMGTGIRAIKSSHVISHWLVRRAGLWEKVEDPIFSLRGTVVLSEADFEGQIPRQFRTTVSINEGPTSDGITAQPMGLGPNGTHGWASRR